MPTQRIAFTVHGRVQGVFFRVFTIEKATSYNLTGWVQNSSDDKVRGEAQGEEDDVKKLLKDINDGPRAAHVVRVDKEEIEVIEGESEFQKR